MKPSTPFLLALLLTLTLPLSTALSAETDQGEVSISEAGSDERSGEGSHSASPEAEAADETREPGDPGSREIEGQLIRPIGFGLGIPGIVLHGFADLGYMAEWRRFEDAGDDSSNHFALGGLDLFVTSALSEDFSFLAETSFHFVDNETAVDVERFLLMYEYRDWLKVNAGRGHTAIGYWNQRFHHGKWLQTTIDRPLLYAFEDDGGILPVHFTGLEIFGNVDSPIGLFRYTAFVSNGRGEDPDQVQITSDFNPAKAAGFLLRYSPHFLTGSGIGANGYFDEIPAVAGVPARAESMREYIYGAHLYVVQGPWEVMVEGSLVLHDDRVADERHRSGGTYAQFAYRLRNFKPYYRYDWLRVAEGDPFYVGLASVGETMLHTLGVRWNVRTFVAFKLEYRHRNTEDWTSNEIGMQASLAF